MNDLNVSILLTTHNGEKYLKEQLDSILNQTYEKFTVYISDDNSTDNTLDIINQFVEKNPQKIKLQSAKVAFGSAKANFLNLLNAVDSDVYLFSDQDDVWTTHHVSKLVEAYKNLNDDEKNQPVVVHSDLYVVDSKLNIISNSFFDYSRKEKQPENKFYYFLDNNVTGCVMLINDKLKKIVLNEKTDTLKQLELLPQHDQFLACAASLFGHIYFIDEPLEYYRQHENNEVGAKNKSGFSFYLSKFFNPDTKWKVMAKNLVTFYLENFGEILNKTTKNQMNCFLNSFNLPKIRQFNALKQSGFIKNGSKKRFLQFLSLFKR